MMGVVFLVTAHVPSMGFESPNRFGHDTRYCRQLEYFVQLRDGEGPIGIYTCIHMHIDKSRGLEYEISIDMGYLLFIPQTKMAMGSSLVAEVYRIFHMQAQAQHDRKIFFVCPRMVHRYKKKRHSRRRSFFF